MMLKTDYKTVRELIENTEEKDVYVTDGTICYHNPKSNIILDKEIKFYRIHEKSNKFDNNYIYVRI